jgi:tetratricopeptide (TPR) repeat protein
VDYAERGIARAELGQWAAAAADFALAVASGADDEIVWRQQVLACLAGGDHGAYRSAVKSLLARFGTTENAATAYWVSWSSVLAPLPADDLKLPLELAGKAAAEQFGRPEPLTALGAALYRAERLDEAVKRLEKAEEKGGTDSGPNRLFLAMAHARLGHSAESQRWFEKAGAGERDLGAPAGDHAAAARGGSGW